jgi:hypothetical protein
MSMTEMIVVSLVGLAGAGALWWLSRPLCDALRWLSDPDEAQQSLHAEDVRAAHQELTSRP